MPIQKPVDALIFDWGDTIMRDFGIPGPMADWEKVEYIPGAEEALSNLSPHFTCVIATSADHSGTEEMIAALKRVNANRYFHHFFASRDLGYKKPDPEFFKSITRKIGLTPGRCIMIGNIFEKDIVGAAKAGLQTILFDEHRHEGTFHEADEIITHMKELPKLLI